MVKIEVELTIVPKTAFHIGTGYGLAGICDSTTVRGSDKLAYIPGSTLKGRIKHHYRTIAKAMGFSSLCKDDSPCSVGQRCVLCSLFGSPLRPGGVIFGNGVLSDNLRNVVVKDERTKRAFEHVEKYIRTNVTINRSRRVAEPERLFSVETINPEMEYKASISGDFEPTMSIDSVPVEAALLVAAIRSVDAFGGRKSRGLGRCVFVPEKIKIDSSEFEVSALIEKLRR